MSSVSQSDIDEMKRIRAILSGSNLGLPQHKTSESNNMNVNQYIDKFEQVSDHAIEQIVEDAKHNPRVNEALHTYSSPSGLVIGSWKVTATIVENKNNKRKLYTVSNTNTTEKVFDGLTVSEAAHAIVRYLNKGLTLRDPKIMSILDLEETYDRNRYDAMRFKQRYARCVELKEMQAAHIFADRYQASRAHALVAHDQIKSILDAIK